MAVPIRKILIANRGEIALRIMRAARELGYFIVGIYSASDKDALWIKQCDEAWPLGDGGLKDTWLNINKIIKIALNSKADAIHPGYGFLSENYEFAQACLENGILFIGPSPEVLKLTGDKLASHNLARQLGIHVPEKFSGSPAELSALKDTMHYPVLVKAVAGGGGKGMRLVNDPTGLNEALKTAASEALQYFGDNRIFIESYIGHARHVEVQLLGDQMGNIVHLMERECSIQRRHQKIIEECPASGLADTIRHDLFKASLSIARSIGFTNAGTVEFLVDDSGEFYFLEINPRIQVEHGITEMVTGIDVVKEQFAIAGGKPLSFGPNDIHSSGHAIETRIYAEDPENDLLPSPGQVFYFNPPDIHGIRIETAVQNGTTISPDFDPLIAKLLVHAPSRTQAVLLMQRALNEFVITGLPHNLPLLKEIICDKAYQQNEVSTAYLDSNMEVFSNSIARVRNSVDPVIPAIGAAMLTLSLKPEYPDNSPWTGFWRNVRKIRFLLNNRVIELDYGRMDGNFIEFFCNEERFEVNKISSDDHQLILMINKEKVSLYPVMGNDGVLAISDGNLEFSVRNFTGRVLASYSQEAETSNGTGDTVLAPQPGTIMDIRVTEGQQVNRGDFLLTIESMKLENTILADRQGFIKKITIKTGDKVKKNEPLIYLQEIHTN